MSTATNFNDTLRLIRKNEPVTAGVTNRMPLQLDDRLRYLWDLVKAASIGSAIFARQVTCEPDADVGHPVYWNSANSRFERAIAGITYDPALGTMSITAASQVWGIVHSKINSTLCDLLLFGYAQLDITDALDAGQTLQAGTYYLSRVTPGGLIFGRPPIAMPVLRTSGNGYVFVNPQWDERTDAATTIRFKLKAIPAGTHEDPGVGNPHTIDPANDNVEGWLPADNAIFEGHAPDGAKFGYNLSAAPALRAAWPPLFPENALLMIDGVSAQSGEGGIVRFDQYGIWWMSDCYDDVPWIPELDTFYVAESESIEVSESLGTCPFPTAAMTIDLFFSKFNFLSPSTVVTSLASADARVVIECPGIPDVPASVGPLQISLDLTFLTDDVDPGSYLVIKSFDAVNQKFHRGPAATGLYAAGNNITLVSDNNTTETISSVARTIHHGRVGINVDTSFNRELFPQLVRLDGVTEEFHEEVMYLAFPVGEQTAMRVRFCVPETLDLVSPVFRLKLRVLGRAAGTLPPLTVTMRRIPAEVGIVPVDLPTADTAVVIDTEIDLTDDDQYVDVAATSFAVVAGDDVLFTIQRAADDDYVGETGILRMTGLLIAT